MPWGRSSSGRDRPLADIWRLPAAYTPAAKQQGLPWRLRCGANFHVYHIGIQQTCFLPVTKTIFFPPFLTFPLSVCLLPLHLLPQDVSSSPAVLRAYGYSIGSIEVVHASACASAQFYLSRKYLKHFLAL